MSNEKSNDDCLVFALWVAEQTHLKNLNYMFFSDTFAISMCGGKEFRGKIDKLYEYWKLHEKQ